MGNSNRLCGHFGWLSVAESVVGGDDVFGRTKGGICTYARQKVMADGQED